jgi:hypothetical protein
MAILSGMPNRLLVILLVAMCIGCRSEPALIDVPIGDRRVSLQAYQWRKIANEVDYARNFEAVTNKAPRQYQILTVFLNQMTEDRIEGQQIAKGEWMDMFISNPGEVSVLLRRDHGRYWVLSREMFRGIDVAEIDLSQIRSLGSDEQKRIVHALQDEIDTTRHLLSELVAR